MQIIKTERIDMSENELDALNLVLRMTEGIKREATDPDLQSLAADIIWLLNSLYDWSI